MATPDFIVSWFEDVGLNDVGRVGGKNASLGEMIRSLKAEEIRVPDGYATTAHAYRNFLSDNALDGPIRADLECLARGTATLEEIGARIRARILEGRVTERIAQPILEAYRELCRRAGRSDVEVAVRSSATAEDLPEASFAGQQESFLNVRGAEPYSTPAGGVSPRYLPTVRSATGLSEASITCASHSPPEFNAWSGRISQVPV